METAAILPLKRRRFHHKTLEESEENDAVDPKKLQDLESKKLKYLHKSHRDSKHEMLKEIE